MKRLILISDLHIAASARPMMSNARTLAGFIGSLPARRRDDEDLELVIAGDFVDFLAIEPLASWTPNESTACGKLARTMRMPPFSAVFDALASFLAAGNHLTIVLGNHDVELILPGVQGALCERIGGTWRNVHWVDDGRAYRVGEVLIEHGNRYDGANVNDWDGLRAVASARSRGESSPEDIFVSGGSEIVNEVINPLKARYPFIDLLQPQGELTALLLLAFEPDLMSDWGMIAQLLLGRAMENENPRGLQPLRHHNIGFRGEDTQDRELEETFGRAYARLRARTSTRPVGAREWFHVWRTSRKHSLSRLLESGERVEPERLQRIRVAMRRLLLGESSAALDSECGQYGEAARRLCSEGTSLVIMGHTHLARDVTWPEGGRYMNTGTWADIIRVPEDAIAIGQDAALEAFLRHLHRDDAVRSMRASYADVRVGPSGKVERADLCLLDA